MTHDEFRPVEATELFSFPINVALLIELAKGGKMTDMTEQEYGALSDSFVKDAPALSGNPGFLSRLREAQLVNDLLDPEYARIVNAKAAALSVPQSEIIQKALRDQMSFA